MAIKNILGRRDEIKRLDACLARDEAQLIAVYGRRRIGKTYLINHYFDGRFDFKLTGIFDQPLSMQLKNFAIELAGQTGKGISVPKDWMEAFSQLDRYIRSKPQDEKIIIFFDELPWMDSPRSGFLTAFEWFWNSFGSSVQNLVFVVAGSATSWMRINLDENRGGLYNRLTCRIYVKPFSLSETEAYLHHRDIHWSRYDVALCYMVMGGIPYYLSLLRPDLTVDQNIDNMFFRKRAELFDEFTFLYRTLFKNSELHIRIAEQLSKNRSGLSREEIARSLYIADNGRLTQMLADMEYSGFIRINAVYGSRKKQYQLSDYYSLFYFRFIKDHYGADERYWSHMLDNPARRAWTGLTFEQVCMDHVERIKEKLGISGVLTETSVWSTKADDTYSGAQIDMVIRRRDKVTNLCEIKYSSDEYVIDRKYDLKLRNKIGIFQRKTGTRDTLQLTFISTYGVKPNVYSGIVQNEVVLDDLFG